MGCVLSLDVGTKTIGIARGSTESGLAAPLQTLSRKSVRKDSLRIAEICREHGASVLVVGLPLHLDGKEGRSVRLARQVGDGVGSIIAIEVHYHDERFSTVEAERRLRDAGRSHGRRRELIDAAAAAVILEDWLLDQRAS
jgi:putative holliday junction resolvase